jgi:hypothetical protein
MRIQNLFDPGSGIWDPGWKKVRSRSGINILDPATLLTCKGNTGTTLVGKDPRTSQLLLFHYFSFLQERLTLGKYTEKLVKFNFFLNITENIALLGKFTCFHQNITVTLINVSGKRFTYINGIVHISVVDPDPDP